MIRRSHALVDPMRSVDKQRIRRLFGQVTRAEMASIDEGLVLYLGLARVG